MGELVAELRPEEAVIANGELEAQGASMPSIPVGLLGRGRLLGWS